MQLLRKVGEQFLDALFPPDAVCFACNGEAKLDDRYLCENCAAQIHASGTLRCPSGLNGVSAGFLYTEAMHHCIYRFKYGGEQHLANALARMMRLPEGCVPDSILPVPLHKNRLKERGYNQSELLARAFAARTGYTVDTLLLMRVKETQPQASLNKEERILNVKGAFQAKNVQGKTLLLVDDLFTTGNTLAACALALKAQGAKAVYAACACAVE